MGAGRGSGLRWGCKVDIHIIRLRAGWECAAPRSAEARSIRLILPARAASFPTGRLRLTRRFSRPPRAPDATAVLRLSRCPGIHSVHLNGNPAGPTSPEEAEFALSLGHLAPRNELIIEADPPRADEEWGIISLIFAAGPAGLRGTSDSDEEPDVP